jgi:hypothetical protein
VSHRRRARVRVAIALLVTAVAAGCGLLPGADAGIPIESLELEPRPVQGDVAREPAGPARELLRGRVDGGLLQVVAQPDAEGLCIAVWGGGGVSWCGPRPGGPMGPLDAFSVFGQDRAPYRIVGVTAPEVAEVVLELEDDRHARAVLVSLAPIGVAGKVFIIHVPTTEGLGVVGYDARGVEISRGQIVRPRAR